MSRRSLKAGERVPENLQVPQWNPIIAETQKEQGTLSFFAYHAFAMDKNAPPFQGQSSWPYAEALRLPCYPGKQKRMNPSGGFVSVQHEAKPVPANPVIF